MMKHLFVLVALCAACSLDDSEPGAPPDGAAGTPGTATSSAPLQPSASGARAPAASAQPSAAGAPAPAANSQPSAAGARAPMNSAGAAATVTGAAGVGAPAANTAGAPATVTAMCEVLERCCPALSDPTLRSTCEGVARARAENACAQVTPMLCGGAPSSASCASLSSCCSTLDEEDREDCEAAVAEADPAACDEAQAELCPATTPHTPGTMTDACPKLMVCCMSLSDDEDQEECTEVVADADAAACGESLSELCPDPNAPPPPESDD